MKRIVICGAGEVGRHASELLAQQNHNVTIIDLSAKKLRDIEDAVDVQSIRGSACFPEILQNARVDQADMLFAATDKDEINLLTAALAKRMGCRKVVARLHHRSYLTSEVLDYRDAFGIDHLICPEQLTSQAISAKIAEPGCMEITHFAGNQLEMHRYTVKRSSKSAGVRLRDLNIPKGLRIALVQRGNDYFTPDAETVLTDRDVVTTIGVPESFVGLQAHFDTPTANRKVAVIGGTSLGEWVVEDLYSKDFSIRWFEADRAKAVELSERYPHITVINSDPTIPAEFEAEQLDRCAAFIAATDDDEHNILSALQAKRMGVGITAAVIHSPTFLSLLENLGIDLPFSPRIVAARTLMEMVDDSPVKKLGELAPRTANLYEVGPAEKGLGVGVELKDLTMPKGSFIAAIQRHNEVVVPGGHDAVRAGDQLIIIGPRGIKKQLMKLFLA